MTIDMSQFKKTFLEESFEGLDLIENSLINFDVDTASDEEINSIFRAAHSIKGGSGTFGFHALTELTHVAETLLDQIRNHLRPITPDIIAVFLEVVDCLRKMLMTYQEEREPDTQTSSTLEKKLNQFLVSGPGDSAGAQAQVTDVATGLQTYEIDFRPHENIMLSGNDPVRIIKELQELGQLEVTTHHDRVPPLTKLMPEHCFLRWTLQLTTDKPKSDIEEVFDWVEGDCDLTITPTQDTTCDQAPSTMVAQTASTKVDAEEKLEVNKEDAKAQVTSIRVDIAKIDALLNLVGELVITQSMLCQLGSEETHESQHFGEGLSLLAQHTRELQESVMKIRMVPISFIFNRVPRMVFDLSKKLNKQVKLEISGEQTELDKTVMEKLSDPLTHLVRNSLDHGIEEPEQRMAAGKPGEGRLQLNAFHQSGNIIIQVIDDGGGINKDKVLKKAIEKGLVTDDKNLSDDQIVNLIFQPGFSTADEISDVSGRGVGMDVVRNNIEKLGGQVEVKSTPGQGSVFTIQLPLTLAILEGQLLTVGNQTYIVPLTSIIESIQVYPDHVETIKGSAEVYKLRDEYIPIARLHQLFNVPNAKTSLEDGLLIILEAGGDKVGLLVDELLGQQQVVIKSLEDNYKKIEGVAGATILGSGTVALIIDVVGIYNLSTRLGQAVSVKHVAA